jgi:hypothetical protein
MSKLQNLGIWLADSPLGGMLKAALGAVLVYVLDNVASFDLAPVVIIALGAALPVAINYVNGMDVRYGSVSE